MPAKKTRKRAAKPKPPAEEPQTTEVTGGAPMYVKPDGTPLPFEPDAEDKEPKWAPVDVPADGTLLRMDGAPAVFVMRDGQRRPFANAEAFTACGFGWNDIVVLPPKEIVPIPVGPEVVRASDLQGEGA